MGRPTRRVVAGQFHQIKHRPSFGRGGRRRNCGLFDGFAPTMAPAHFHAANSRPRLYFSDRSKTDGGKIGIRADQLVRFWRRQRHAHPAEVVVSRIYVEGCGAVSPAGWGVAPLREAISKGEAISIKELPRPGWNQPLKIRAVPPPQPRPVFMTHARLRRTSPITQYAVAAALEALGNDAEQRCQRGTLRARYCSLRHVGLRELLAPFLR